MVCFQKTIYKDLTAFSESLEKDEFRGSGIEAQL